MSSRKIKVSILTEPELQSAAPTRPQALCKTVELAGTPDDEQDERRKRIEDNRAVLDRYLELGRIQDWERGMACNERIALWGVMGPMHKREEQLHRAVRLAFVGERSALLPIEYWRQQMVLGTWKLGKDLAYDVALMEPLIHTSTMEAIRISRDEVARAASKIKTVQQGSGSNRDVKRAPIQGKYRIVGRFSAPTVKAYELLTRSEYKSEMSFVGLGGSAFTVIINFRGNLKTCLFTKTTLKLLEKKLAKVSVPSVVPSLNRDCLRIHLQSDSNKNSTYVRIDTCGSFTVQGSPAKVAPLLTALRTALKDLAEDRNLCYSFILSLQVIESV